MTLMKDHKGNKIFSGENFSEDGDKTGSEHT